MTFDEWWKAYLEKHPIQGTPLRKYTEAMARAAWYAGQAEVNLARHDEELATR